MSGTVLAVSCRYLVAYAATRGYPTGAWLEHAGLTDAYLEDPDARLDATSLFALWSAAYAATNDAALALHVAESLPRGAYRAVEYLAAHAPTVGAAYTKLADYFSVIDASTELMIADQDRHPTFGPRHGSPNPATHPAFEYLLAACYLRVLDMTGTPHRPTAVDFTAPRQAHGAELERVFGCPVRWNAAAPRLHFSKADWDNATAHPDPTLLAVLEEHARHLKQQHPRTTSFRQVLDQALDRAWEHGEPRLEAVARQLGLSSRSLQRRLGELETGFSERVDDARKRAALRWLACSDVSLSEVAYLVGFKEQASLTRAVRRWTGRTPRELRFPNPSGLKVRP